MRLPPLAALVSLTLVFACGKKPTGEPLEKTPQPSAETSLGSADPAGVKLVVLIVIDQLPSWTFTRDAGQLSGGIGRLLREGVYFPEVALPYANTYTAPGHATIGTGAGPRVSGILANGWNRNRGGKFIPATSDPSAPLFDLRGGNVKTVEGIGAGPSALRVPGIADVLAEEKPNAKSVSIGLKQRAAILMLGRKPSAAVWYESTQLGMTTSAHYGVPSWLVPFNKANPVGPRLAETWSVSDPDFLRRYTGVDDDSDGEGAGIGFAREFPHNIEKSPAAAKAFRMMPASVDYLLAAGRAAIDGEKLGARGQRDLLAITISTHDYVGHFWGQESWERFDILRRIDVALGVFFADLDKRFGAAGYSVVFTSDHGVEPLIERSIAVGREARRITVPEIVAAVERGFGKTLGKGRWVSGYAANSIYLSALFKSQPKKTRDKAIAAVLQELRAVPNVGFAELTRELVQQPTADNTSDCSHHGAAKPLRQIACESIHIDETGDITVFPARYSLFQAPGYETGTGHGGPSVESRIVPVIVRAPGVAPLRSVERTTMYQVAPTLAALLQISAPSGSSSPALPLVADPTDTLGH